MGDAAGQLAHRLQLLGLHQLGLGLAPFRDLGREAGVGVADRLLGRLGLRHVAADDVEDLSLRHRRPGEPAVVPRSRPDPEFEGTDVLAPDQRASDLAGALHVLRVGELEERPADEIRLQQARDARPGGIHQPQVAVEASHGEQVVAQLENSRPLAVLRRDPVLQQPPRLHDVVDVGRYPEPAAELAFRRLHRGAAGLEPTVRAVRGAQPVLDIVDAAPGDRLRPSAFGMRPVLGVHGGLPAQAEMVFRPSAGVGEPLRAQVVAPTVRPGGPDQLRGGFRERLELDLPPVERGLDPAPLGDVGKGGGSPGDPTLSVADRHSAHRQDQGLARLTVLDRVLEIGDGFASQGAADRQPVRRERLTREVADPPLRRVEPAAGDLAFAEAENPGRSGVGVDEPSLGVGLGDAGRDSAQDPVEARLRAQAPALQVAHRLRASDDAEAGDHEQRQVHGRGGRQAEGPVVGQPQPADRRPGYGGDKAAAPAAVNGRDQDGDEEGRERQHPSPDRGEHGADRAGDRDGRKRDADARHEAPVPSAYGKPHNQAFSPQGPVSP